MKISLAVAGCLAGFVLGSAGVHAQNADKSMTVFVTAAQVTDVKNVDEETRKRFSAAIQAAKTTRKDLEKTLKAQHGNTRENWPPAAEDTYAAAEEAEALANADWAYLRVKQEGLLDSAVIEVNGRRSGKSALAGLRDDEFWISFLVKAGPKLSAAQFAGVPLSYRLAQFRYRVWRLAIPRADSPQWRFEAFNSGKWTMAANAVSILIEDFIQKNDNAMMAAKTTR